MVWLLLDLHNYFGSMSDVAFKMLYALIHNLFLWATKEMAPISEMVKKQEGPLTLKVFSFIFWTWCICGYNSLVCILSEIEQLSGHRLLEK